MEKKQALLLKDKLDTNPYLKNVSSYRRNEYFTKKSDITEDNQLVIEGEKYFLGSIMFYKNKIPSHPKFNEYYLEIFVYDLLGIADIFKVYDYYDGLYMISTIAKF